MTQFFKTVQFHVSTCKNAELCQKAGDASCWVTVERLAVL